MKKNKLTYINKVEKSKKKSPLFVFLIPLILIQIGCKKFVQVDPPVTGVPGTTVFSNNTSAAAVLTGIYDQMHSSSQNLADGNYSISNLCGLSADELTNYSSDITSSTFYTNSLSASNFAYFWPEIYQEIYVANAAISGLSSSPKLSPSLKQQLMGEAKFMRAFLHFYAVNLFGDVPLITTTDYRINNVTGRSPKAQVYQQIIADLKDAQNILSDNYLDASNIITANRIRPNKGAANALLARVYLYTAVWDSAEKQATSVINSGMYSLLANSNLNNVFLKNSSEAIWQLQSFFPGFNTFDAYFFVLTSKPGTGRFNTALSSYLLNSFEPSDSRMSNWIGTFNSGGQTYYYPCKYKVGTYNVGSPVTEYLMVLRLAEVYLIRAEARAQQGNISGAQADLNAIRNRAGLVNTVANTKSDLLNAIYHERQVELFTEWGHRWFDLKRTGTVDAIMSVVTPQKGGAWSPSWALFPIPQSDILINARLTQNPAY